MSEKLKLFLVVVFVILSITLFLFVINIINYDKIKFCEDNGFQSLEIGFKGSNCIKIENDFIIKKEIEKFQNKIYWKK